MTVVVDTGPLVAAADRDDVAHRLARTLLSELAGPLIVPTPVLTEAEYLIRRRVDPTTARNLVADTVAGTLTHMPLEARDLERALAVMDSHPGIELGLADATVVAVAERLKAKALFTFDHRDFRRVRPAHVRAFDLVPSEADLGDLRRPRRGRR